MTDKKRSSASIINRYRGNLRLQLIIVFAVIAAVIAGCFGLTRSLAPALSENLILRDEQAFAEARAQNLLSILEDGANSFVSGTLTPQDLARLDSVMALSDVYRQKFFDPAGRIFWSTRRDEIGSVQNTAAFDRVRSGETIAILAHKPAREVDGLQERVGIADGAVVRTVIELYIPYHDASGRFMGAIELYKDISDQTAVFARRFSIVANVIVTIGGVLLFFSILIILRLNNHRLIRVEMANQQERNALARQQELASQMKVLGDMNEWLQASNSLDELFSMVARFLSHLVPDTAGAIYVYSNSRDVLDGAATWNGASVHDHIHPQDCWSLRRGRTYFYDGGKLAIECTHATQNGSRAYLCFPILAHGETVGLIHLRSTIDGEAGRDSLKQTREFAQMCAEHISLAISNVQMRDTLQEKANRDPLTGLFNRRHLGEHLRSSLRTADRNGTSLSVIAFDIDHFKRFNDTYGHDAGDLVLTEVARFLREAAVDESEAAARLGGEEFALVLPAIEREDAIKRAETLRVKISEISLSYGGSVLPSVTISSGIACYPQDATTAHDLLLLSDAALYQAKSDGRNRVVGRPPKKGGVADAPETAMVIEHAAE